MLHCEICMFRKLPYFFLTSATCGISRRNAFSVLRSCSCSFSIYQRLLYFSACIYISLSSVFFLGLQWFYRSNNGYFSLYSRVERIKQFKNLSHCFYNSEGNRHSDLTLNISMLTLANIILLHTVCHT